MQPSSRRFRALAAVGAIGVVALSACGSGASADGVASLTDDTDSTGDDTTGSDVAGGDTGDGDDVAATEEQMLEFAQCMRDNGVDIGDPVVDADGNVTFGDFGPGRGPGAGGDDGGGPPDETREAFTACGDLLDGAQFGRGRGADFDPTELQDSLLDFAQCMRDNGVDMDDPDFSSFEEPGGDEQGGGPGGGGPFATLDRSDPEVEAAMESCQDILGGFGPGGAGGGPGGNPPGTGGDS